MFIKFYNGGEEMGREGTRTILRAYSKAGHENFLTKSMKKFTKDIVINTTDSDRYLTIDSISFLWRSSDH